MSFGIGLNWLPRALGALAVSAATLLAPAVSASAQTDRQVEWCNGDGNATREQSIGGCSAMIESGAYAGEELAIVLNNRGIAYFKDGRFESAIQDFDQAIALRPNFLSALISRGFAYLIMKNYGVAIAAFDHALEAYPDNAPSLYGRALAKRATGDAAGADAGIAAAQRIDPTIAQDLAALGVKLDAAAELTALAPAAGPAGAPPDEPSAAPPPAGETASLPPAAAAASAGGPPAVEQTAAPPAPAEEIASLPLSAEVTEALIERGNQLLRNGDIVAARLAFERAAAGGNRTAATGVAKTYDPVFLALSGVRGLRGDPARAALWYGKAAAAGSHEAQERLKRLRAQFPQ
jgi:tetratricopeptide (TPR) repeat protein